MKDLEICILKVYSLDSRATSTMAFRSVWFWWLSRIPLAGKGAPRREFTFFVKLRNVCIPVETCTNRTPNGVGKTVTRMKVSKTHIYQKVKSLQLQGQRMLHFLRFTLGMGVPENPRCQKLLECQDILIPSLKLT